MFEQSYGFNQIAIKQKQCIVKSRKDIKIESEIIRGIRRPELLIASNMSNVVNADFCIKLYKLGSLGFMHRAFQDNNKYIEEVIKISEICPVTVASVGINEKDYFLVEQLIRYGRASVICIDVAHCFSKNTLIMCKHIRENYPTIRIVVGNTINPNAIEFFNDYVDAIKVGCASGSCCETRNTSGCYKPQFSAVYDMKEKAQKYGMPLISDGGVREPADFSKSIGAGASATMAGYIFARCPESAAKIIEIDGTKKKSMSGMASRLVQEEWKNKVSNDCPEGATRIIDIGEPVEDLIKRYAGALRSGISYSGFNNIQDFREGCDFILV